MIMVVGNEGHEIKERMAEKERPIKDRARSFIAKVDIQRRQLCHLFIASIPSSLLCHLFLASFHD